MRNKFIIIFISILLLTLVSVNAVQMNAGTSYNSTSGINVTCTSIFYADLISVDANDIYFVNYSIDDGDSTTTFNLTNIQNFNCSDLPYFNSINNVHSNINSIQAILITNTNGHDCSEVTSLTFNNNTYSGGVVKNICNSLNSGYTTTINSGDNTFSFIFGSTTITSSILKILILILGVGLCIAALAIFYLYAKNNYNLVPINDFVKAAIIFLIVEVLVIALISYIVTLV